MPTFKVQKYALYVRTYLIEADTASEAVSGINEETPAVAAECIGLPEGEDMERVASQADLTDAHWLRLFDEWPGGAVETIPALRTVQDLHTGERWDRFDGYWPPASVPSERKVGTRV